MKIFVIQLLAVSALAQGPNVDVPQGGSYSPPSGVSEGQCLKYSGGEIVGGSCGGANECSAQTFLYDGTNAYALSAGVGGM